MTACPTGCGRSVCYGHLLCGSCWSRVPQPLRTDVWRTFRAWRRNVGDADRLRAYRAAADAATASAA